MLTVICLLSVLVFVAADKDPLEFTEETCVKIFYTGDHFYNIYCLNVLDEAGTLGVVTSRNHKIIFRINAADIEDQSKICVNVLTETNVEKYCIDAIQHNCVSKREDMNEAFPPKPNENVDCLQRNMEETHWACMGVTHPEFTLIMYCKLGVPNIRRKVIDFPYNKEPPRQ